MLKNTLMTDLPRVCDENSSFIFLVPFCSEFLVVNRRYVQYHIVPSTMSYGKVTVTLSAVKLASNSLFCQKWELQCVLLLKVLFSLSFRHFSKSKPILFLQKREEQKLHTALYPLSGVFLSGLRHCSDETAHRISMKLYSHTGYD